MDDAKDWDPDKKFMSANDLCEAVLNDLIKEQDQLNQVV